MKNCIQKITMKEASQGKITNPDIDTLHRLIPYFSMQTVTADWVELYLIAEAPYVDIVFTEGIPNQEVIKQFIDHKQYVITSIENLAKKFPQLSKTGEYEKAMQWLSNYKVEVTNNTLHFNVNVTITKYNEFDIFSIPMPTSKKEEELFEYGLEEEVHKIRDEIRRRVNLIDEMILNTQTVLYWSMDPIQHI